MDICACVSHADIVAEQAVAMGALVLHTRAGEHENCSTRVSSAWLGVWEMIDSSLHAVSKTCAITKSGTRIPQCRHLCTPQLWTASSQSFHQAWRSSSVQNRYWQVRRGLFSILLVLIYVCMCDCVCFFSSFFVMADQRLFGKKFEIPCAIHNHLPIEASWTCPCMVKLADP